MADYSASRRLLGMALLIVAVFLFLTWGRAFYGSMKAYQTGEELLKQKQVIRAITYFDRSIHWYTPWNPYVENSAQRLWEIGEQALQQGDITMALIAFRTIRGGFYAASHVITPGKDWIQKSESKIDDLVRMERKSKAESKLEEKPMEEMRHGQKGSSPDVFWTVVLEIGLFGWLGSLLGLILSWGKSSKGSGKTFLRTLTWIGFALCFFAFWILGMMKA